MLVMVMLLMTLYVVAVYVVDDRFYLHMVQEAVNDSTGHTVKVDGQFTVERSLRPGLVAEEVRLINPGAGPAAEIAHVERLHFRIELLELLKGKLRFAVTLMQPRIHLRVDTGGRRNWQVGAANESPGGDPAKDGGWDAYIDHVEIFDGRLMYADARDDSRVELEIASFALQHDRKAGLATLGFLGAYQGTDYSINGTLGEQAKNEPLRAELMIDAYAAGSVADRDAPPVMHLSATGNVSRLDQDPGFDLAVDGRIEDWLPLANLFGIRAGEWTSLTPVTARTRVRLQRGAYHLDDLDARWATDGLTLATTGRVSDVGRTNALDLKLSTTVVSLSTLSQLPVLSKTALPELGPLNVQGTVRGSRGDYRVDDLRASLDAEDLDVTADGTITGLGAQPQARVDVTTHISDLSRVASIFGIEARLPSVGPVSLETRLEWDADRIQASELAVQVGGSDVTGQMSLHHKQAPARLSARLVSRKLDLDQLLAQPAPPDAEQKQTDPGPVEPDPNETAAADGADTDTGEKPWLPTEQLDLSWLDTRQGLIHLRVDQMIQDGDTFDDVVVQVQLEPGVLYVPVTRMKLNEGELSLNVGIDATQSPPAFHYRNVVKDIEIRSLLNLPEGVITGGRTSGTVDLHSSGSSMAEIMSNLDGQILLRMGEGRIVEAGLAKVSSALLGGMLSGVSQTEDGQPYTDYQCGVFGFEFNDGIVNMKRSIALQSKRFNVGGSGQVDLNKGTIHLELRPRARKGLGISAAMLTGGFKISGKLQAAEAGLSLKGLLESYLLSSTAALLAANPAGGVATGAVLALRGVWDRITAGTFSCKNTLKRIEGRTD